MKKNSKLHDILSHIVESAPSLRGRAGGEAVFLFLLSLLFLTSCGDNGEGEYLFTNSIRIVSQNVSDMPVQASEGTIVVDASSAIDATASADWFTASVSGKTITVKTTDNNNIEYRSGKITIRSGNDVTDVAVIQRGTIVSVQAKDIYLNDSTANLQIPFTSNYDIKCYTAEDWISYKVGEGVISVSVAENATGHIRSGYIYYGAGAIKDSVFIRQCELEKDLLGDLQLAYLDKNAQTAAFNAKFVASTDTAGVTSYALVFTDYNFVIPVSFDEKKLTISMNAGQAIGKYQGYFVLTQFYDLKNYEITSNEKVSISGQFFYDKDDKATYLEFEDNGSWGNGLSATSLILHAYDAKGNDGGTLAVLHFPYLIRAHKK